MFIHSQVNNKAKLETPSHIYRICYLWMILTMSKTHFCQTESLLSKISEIKTIATSYENSEN